MTPEQKAINAVIVREIAQERDAMLEHRRETEQRAVRTQYISELTQILKDFTAREALKRGDKTRPKFAVEAAQAWISALRAEIEKLT